MLGSIKYSHKIINRTQETWIYLTYDVNDCQVQARKYHRGE